MKHSAAEYFARNIWVSANPEERMFPLTVQFAGDDRFFIGSDYPHAEGFVHPVRTTLELLAALPQLVHRWKRSCATAMPPRSATYPEPATVQRNNPWPPTSRYMPQWNADFDAICVWLGSLNATSPSAISRGEFGAVATERLLEMLARWEISSTWFIPGHTIDTYPDLVRRVADAGHEIGIYNYCHENPISLSLDDEKRVLDRGTEAIRRMHGKGAGGLPLTCLGPEPAPRSGCCSKAAFPVATQPDG